MKPFLIDKRSIFTNVYGKLLPQFADFKNHTSWASWTLKMEAASCSEKSTTIYHVYGVIFLKTLLLIRISVRTLNFLMQSLLFYVVLVHETIDLCTMGVRVCTTTLTEKNLMSQSIKDLDYVVNLPLNELKWGLWIAMNYIVCHLICIKKNLHSQYKSLKGIIICLSFNKICY